MNESNMKDGTVEDDQSVETKGHKDSAINGNSTKRKYSNANKDESIKTKDDDVNKNGSSRSSDQYNVKKEVKSENEANKPTKDKDGDENNVNVVYFNTGQGVPEEEKLHEDTIASTEDENIDYHNLPHHFDEDGNITKLVPVKNPSSKKIAVEENNPKTFSVLELDSEENSKEEEFDENNIPHHFDEDGSIQKLGLPKKSSSKNTGEERDLRTFSVGNFLMEDVTIEEVRVPLEDLELDSEEDSKEEFDEQKIPHHFDEDGSIQKLVLPKTSSSKEIAEKNAK